MANINEYQLILNFFELEGVPVTPDEQKNAFYDSIQELGNIHTRTDDGRHYVTQVIGIKPVGVKNVKILEDMDVNDSMKIREVLDILGKEESLQTLLNMRDEHLSEKNR